jgi:hypothetical protein
MDARFILQEEANGMDALTRIEAVFAHRRPDRIPFVPYGIMIPRGEFARELGNRGMGLCFWNSTIWSECPHVWTEIRTAGAAGPGTDRHGKSENPARRFDQERQGYRSSYLHD